MMFCSCNVRRRAQGLGIASSIVPCGRRAVDGGRYCARHAALRAKKVAAHEARKLQGAA